MEHRKITEAFVESMSQLMEILQMETDILNTQIYEGIDTLQARKVQLTKCYLEAQNKILIESARANFHFSNANRLSAIQVQKSKYKK